MKLLYITNGITAPAGLERVLSVKASYLADSLGYEVHIITLNESNRTPFYTFSPDIKIHNIDLNRNFFGYVRSYMAGIRKIVKEIKPDVVSVCDDGLKGFFVPLWLRPKTFAILYERHVSREIVLNGRQPSVKHRLQFMLMNRGAKMYDRFVVLTTGNIAEWPRLNHIEVIPNPLPFYPSGSASLENKEIMTVGRLVFQKGYDNLLRIWQLLFRKYPEWRLQIYGEGPDKEMLERQIKNMQLERVYINKPVRSIEKKYLETSVYLLSSRYEGFGMVLIEAMACGVPCVAFDCPCGPEDIVTAGTDGFLVPPGQLYIFAEYLERLMCDPEIRKKMGSEAKQNVQRYLPEKICRQWDMLFKQIISEKAEKKNLHKRS